jgi:hypothetical protein
MSTEIVGPEFVLSNRYLTKLSAKEYFLCRQQKILKMLTDKEVKTVDRG